jgi:PTH1 family peptidyl-tRNA hydrolase
VKLIVGLGNPGKAYSLTRHNIGFRCINYLSRQHNISLTRRQCQAQVGTGEIAGTPVVLAKPLTFMNSSGEAVSSLMQRFHIPVNDLVVVYDDLDLPAGKIRLRLGGSAAGHKGVESIISWLQSQDFARVRIGIGHPPAGKQDVISFLLSNLTSEEKAIIEAAIHKAAQAIYCLIAEGLTIAMNKYN